MAYSLQVYQRLVLQRRVCLIGARMENGERYRMRMRHTEAGRQPRATKPREHHPAPFLHIHTIDTPVRLMGKHYLLFHDSKPMFFSSVCTSPTYLFRVAPW